MGFAARGKLELSLHDMLCTEGGEQQSMFSTPTLASSGTSGTSSDDGVDDDILVQGRRSFQPYHAQSVPKFENLEANASGRGTKSAPVTTMMLRNIPNKYTQNTLIREINSLGFI